MAAIEKKTRRYPTDLTDEEWSQAEGLLPKPRKTGRRRGVDLREVLNGIRYLARTGCGWRTLPVNFPPWQTVYWWFRRFVRLFLFRTIHDRNHPVTLQMRCGSGGTLHPLALVSGDATEGSGVLHRPMRRHQRQCRRRTRAWPTGF